MLALIVTMRSLWILMQISQDFVNAKVFKQPQLLILLHMPK